MKKTKREPDLYPCGDHLIIAISVVATEKIGKYGWMR